MRRRPDTAIGTIATLSFDLFFTMKRLFSQLGIYWQATGKYYHYFLGIVTEMNRAKHLSLLSGINSDLAESRTSLGLITDRLCLLEKFVENCRDQYEIAPCGCGRVYDLRHPDERRMGMCHTCAGDIS